MSTYWKIEKCLSGILVPYEVVKFEGNILLNEGINAIWTLVAGGAATAFSNTNSYIGVGDGTDSLDAAHVGLQGTNKAYAAMVPGYPQYGSDQVIIFRAVFLSGTAEFTWQEYTVANGSSDDSVNLLRKIESIGTKEPGNDWTITVARTLP